MVLVTEQKRRAPSHHKKRTGQHHKQTKHYAKTYWPYLPLLVIVGVGLLANVVWSARTSQVLGYATAMSPGSLLQATNQDRAQSHDQNLQLNAQLTHAAQAKAVDMVQKNYWSHTSPNGTQPWQLIAASGYAYAVAGENLEYGLSSSSQVVAAWMNSAEHRANILNGQFTDVGFGIASSSDFRNSGQQTIVVALYATRATGLAANISNNAGAHVLGAQSSQSISRVQMLTGGGAPWSLLALTLLVGICLGILVIRHSLLWRRVLVRGEVFMVKYHLLDVLLISVGMAGFVLTRAAATIH